MFLEEMHHFIDNKLFFSIDVPLGQHCSDMAFSDSFLSVRSDTSQDISVSVCWHLQGEIREGDHLSLCQ